ncbi:hypothetical protein [Lutibacter flavus]|uniref:Lipoprotein n=1 Tax=Lutibacter flavus TaxID=691689 RepID=A0A238VNG3_9FLAO|nr:hypothetical protein [Lutibacter flavus]SNR35704.1 hypothetical protein SAMN04488111_0757 [Lutibacter flavus]
MKHLLFIFLLMFILTSCVKQSDLSKSFDCKTHNLNNLTTITDFKNNFRISIPSDWKTNLYYDNFQSEIFTADTIKQLSETYILDVSFNYGNLNFDDSFHKKTDSLLTNSNLQKIKSNTIQFRNKPAYWYVVKGTKKGFNYHQFNLIVLNSENTYFTANSEIYGDNNIDDRICESISILDKIEFL